MAKRIGITTEDNPYNPLTDFITWYQFDIAKGYGTLDVLGRLANYTDDMSEEERTRATERAIDLLVTKDPLGIYRKVVE